MLALLCVPEAEDKTTWKRTELQLYISKHSSGKQHFFVITWPFEDFFSCYDGGQFGQISLVKIYIQLLSTDPRTLFKFINLVEMSQLENFVFGSHYAKRKRDRVQNGSLVSNSWHSGHSNHGTTAMDKNTIRNIMLTTLHA